MSESLSVALTRFADLAADHLRKADTAIAELPRNLRAAFAPIALLGTQLKRLDLDAPFAAAAGSRRLAEDRAF